MTDDAVIVMEDILDWGQETIGFRPFVRDPKKIFVSQVIVEFEKPVAQIFGKWDKLGKLSQVQSWLATTLRSQSL